MKMYLQRWTVKKHFFAVELWVILIIPEFIDRVKRATTTRARVTLRELKTFRAHMGEAVQSSIIAGIL